MSAPANPFAPFRTLGRQLQDEAVLQQYFEPLLSMQHQRNPWFTPEFVRQSLSDLAHCLSDPVWDTFNDHLGKQENTTQRQCVAVASHCHAPGESLYDMLSVLLCGHNYLGKPSPQDNLLPPALAKLLTDIEPAFRERIRFCERLTDFDAIIVDTGDRNSNTLLQYFQRLPHLIRPQTCSAALLTGTEHNTELTALADDIYRYFGTAQQSVRMLFVPQGYDFVPLLREVTRRSQPIAQHNTYLNHIDYQKSIRLVNKLYYMDAGTFLFAESDAPLPPIGVVHYQYYTDLADVTEWWSQHCEEIPLFCAPDGLLAGSRPVGTAHCRRPADLLKLQQWL